MRALALFVTALWAAIVAPALADGSRLDAVLERHVLRVGTTGDYRPFTALDKRELANIPASTSTWPGR